jgi:hypothetical protein
MDVLIVFDFTPRGIRLEIVLKMKLVINLTGGSM